MTWLPSCRPSAVLRLRGRPGWDDAFAALVQDLRRAAETAGLSTG